MAIEGGTPVLEGHKFPWPMTTDKIRETVTEALSDGSWGQYDGHWTESLTTGIRTLVGVDEIVLCSSGTVAVELALRGAGVRTGDEVILAGYDFPGNFRAIEAIGARPVLVDVLQNGWVLDPKEVELGISEETSAIVVSHLHGQFADIETINQLVSTQNRNRIPEKQIRIVEDACQVPGGKLKGRPLGSCGDVSAFSFGGSKLLSAGRGGAIATNNPDIRQRALIFSQRGNEAFPMSQLQAAALLPQLETLESLTTTRNLNADWLIAATSLHDVLTGLFQIDDVAQSGNSIPAYYKLPWLLKDQTPGWSRAEFVAALLAEGVPVGEGFRGFLRRTPRRCRKVGTLVNSRIAAQQTILLHHPVLLHDDKVLELVASAFEKVISNPR